MDSNSATWLKASYSNGSGNCVEVGTAPDSVTVRDTTDRDGGTLAFNAQAWRAFAVAIKSDEEV
jgi:hypothetical protein